MHYSVWLLGKRGEKLGSVEARNEEEAIETTVKQFNLTPAVRSKLVVMRIDEKEREA
jgi:hypothetical protein